MNELQRYAKQALSLIDLTSLNLDDTEQDIIKLCHKAQTPYGHVAAVCVYPQFVSVARRSLNDLGLENVKVATVTNFSHGTDSIDEVIAQTEQAINDGADEIDVVLPYQAFTNGDLDHCEQVLIESKKRCNGPTLLKVIIESGELAEPNLIKAASEFCIDCGTDFIKTSTGKVKVNATLESAEIMLTAIVENDTKVGFKAAGGIRTAVDAMAYLKLAENLLGKEWISPMQFRFGASGLLADIVATLNGDTAKDTNSSNY